MKLFLLRASKKLLKYSYHIHIIYHMYFFFASWNKPWKSLLSNTQSCQPTENSTLVRSLRRSCSTGVQTGVGASNYSLRTSTRLYFKEREEILLPCNILILQALLPQMHFCIHIFLTIQSHTFILL